MFRITVARPSSSAHHWIIALFVILVQTSTRCHAALYHGPPDSSSNAYTTATSLFNHVIQHDSPVSGSLHLNGPPPTVAPIGSNIRYLTRSSPAHRSHLAAIYAPSSVRPTLPTPPAAYRSGPPPSSVQYQPGNGAYRVGPSFERSTYGDVRALRARPTSVGPFDLFNLPPLTGHLAAVADLAYIVDGRLLKQYLVMEDHDDDNTLDAFLNDPVNRNAYVPFLPHLNFGQRRPNLGFAGELRDARTSTGGPFQQQSSAQFARLQQQVPRQPTYALGSGSLGFVRHPSGAIYLGSGSLGYINDQQQVDNFQNFRNRQTPGAGPLSFGHTPQ